MKESPSEAGLPRNALGATADPIPASFAQERLAALGAQDGLASTADAIVRGLRIEGSLDVARLERAILEVVARHEVFRTAVDRGSVRVATIADAPGRVLRADVRGDDHEARLQQEARALAAEPFELSRPPLLRALIVQLAEAEHALVVVAHPIVADRRSVDIVVREILGRYSTAPGDAPPAPTSRFGDYASWERTRLDGPGMRELCAARVARLRDVPITPPLPTDRLRSPKPCGAAQSLVVSLPAVTVERVRAFARDATIPPSTVLLTALGIALGRISGEDRLVLGLCVANREKAELRDVVGPLENTLLVPIDVPGDGPFLDTLRHADAAVADAKTHEVPFACLAGHLAPAGEAGATPGVQLAFVTRDAFAKIEGLTIRPLDVAPAATRFDLDFTLEDDGTRGTLRFNADLFEAGTVSRIWARFAHTLDRLLEKPGAYLREAQGLSEYERAELARWAPAPANYEPLLLHEHFERIARSNPNAVAATFGHTKMTYGELNRRAQALASKLSDLGVGPDVSVGVCVERSMEMLVGVLGVLKAGGAYLPLDPTYPRDRLDLMLAASGVAVAITQRCHAEVVARVANVVVLDEAASEAAPPQRDPRRPHADNMAVLNYTSGSTGAPKGSALTHRGVNHVVQFMTSAIRGFRGRTLQQFPLSSQPSVFEVFGAWSCGGTLVLISENDRRDVARLLAILEEEKITCLRLPYVFLRSIAERWANDRRVLALETVTTSGEQLQVTKEIAAFFKAHPRCEFLNQYGLTETAVLTSHLFTDDPMSWPALPPIGKPLPNVRFHVDDAAMKPVPIGVPGELFVAGDCINRGYWRRSDLTAERFLPDPHGPPGARMYKTGDLVRYRSDGTLEHAGRRDFQVKISGYRVELGEVESALRRVPGVRDAVVEGVRSAEGLVRLVAYLIRQREGDTSTGSDIRAGLEGVLPSYMIPAQYVFVPSFPLTPSGKVHRKGLPPPPPPETTATGNVLPRTPLEETIAGIWADVTGASRVGVLDDFFELGGTSLGATRVVARLRDSLHIDLAVRSLFEHSDLASFTRLVETTLSTTEQLEI